MTRLDERGNVDSYAKSVMADEWPEEPRRFVLLRTVRLQKVGCGERRTAEGLHATTPTQATNTFHYSALVEVSFRRASLPLISTLFSRLESSIGLSLKFF